MGFAKNLRRLRKAQGMTQDDVARPLGLSDRAVGAWEAGRAKPRFDKMGDLADLFGVSVPDLMGDDYPAGALPFETGEDAAVPLRAASEKSAGGGASWLYSPVG